MTRREMQERGWDTIDVLIVSGDAYVDHPAFGPAVIGRVLEAAGYRVGIIAQPDWTNPKAFEILGRPRLFIGVTAGAMDSMVANYTANKLPRSDDAYSPGGEAGKRPNNATTVYTSVLRGVFRGVPVVLGGIEASLRRFAHYDYWRDKVRRSVLLDSKADLIVAGMGEKSILEIADRLREERDLHGIAGTVEWRSVKDDLPEGELVTLPSFESIQSSPEHLMEAAKTLEEALAGGGGLERPDAIVQRHADRWVIEYPAPPMSTEELDRIYALPYQRKAHPTYRQPIPALDPVKFSVTSHRGCFGGCSFCALALHQGKCIVPRSPDSIIDEIKRLTRDPDFKGAISDVGGPTANMYGMAGKDEALCAACKRPSCLFPDVCRNLNTSHGALVDLWKRILDIPGVKHAFVASGIRHDLIEADLEMGAAFLKLLAERLVGGQLSVAPEHSEDSVLLKMRKPPAAKFERFVKEFRKVAKNAGRDLYVIPYLIASFPGSTKEDAEKARAWVERMGCPSRQIQDFLPGPMTMAGVMHYTKLDPASGQTIHVPAKAGERREQRDALLGKTGFDRSKRRAASPGRPARGKPSFSKTRSGKTAGGGKPPSGRRTAPQKGGGKPPGNSRFSGKPGRSSRPSHRSGPPHKKGNKR
ncbi:MAG: YgiQ family radical SAM protein [Candidatus Sumerlaeota bacterium]